MIIDGNSIAGEILAEVRGSDRTPHLIAVAVAPTFATRNYLSIKKRTAERAGCELSVIEMEPEVTTEEVISAVVAASQKADGVIVQLPLPPHIDLDAVLKALPRSHDADVMGGEARETYYGGDFSLLPPVVGAISEIATRHHISFQGKKTVVVGEGMLVGAPASAWLRVKGGEVMVLDKRAEDVALHTREADVLVLGAGVPGLITPEMVKEGIIIFDAGTSEEGGVVKGDADPACADKADIFTPVPGGIGPIAVALLFRNLLKLQK